MVNNLRPNTNYSCCVEAQYTDLAENAVVCASVVTLEGGWLKQLVFHLY